MKKVVVHTVDGKERHITLVSENQYRDFMDFIEGEKSEDWFWWPEPAPTPGSGPEPSAVSCFIFRQCIVFIQFKEAD